MSFEFFVGTAFTMVAIFFVVIYIYYKNSMKKFKRELEQQKELVDKNLFVVNFPSQFYVFPYVWGTKQKQVFYLLSDPRTSRVLYECISVEEAKRRIAEIHLAQMEEMDRLGV